MTFTIGQFMAAIVIVATVGSLAVYHYSLWANRRAWLADKEWQQAFEPSRLHVEEYPIPEAWKIDPEPHRISPPT